MITTSLTTLIIGLLSQVCYGLRQLVQWVMTERAGRVVSPTGYWAFSLAGCCFMLSYGWLRDDIVIIAGQVLSFYVYVLNLDYKGAWRRIPLAVRVVLYTVPLFGIAAIAFNAPELVARFLHNPEVPLWLMIYGTTAQAIFISRYAYQVVYSVCRKQSCLPPGFWVISLAGASLIFVYGLLRRDPILILGQSVALIIFARNLYIGLKKTSEWETKPPKASKKQKK